MALFKSQKNDTPDFLRDKKPDVKRRKKALAAKNTKKKDKEVTEFVQDFLPIKDIRNGIIETKDNRYIKILEVEPINFTLRKIQYYMVFC